LLQPKPAIEKLAPCAHGGIDYGELEKLGISSESILDFSVSCNPFGPPSGITEALSNTSVECYPDSEASQLRRLLASRLNIAADNLMVGSGSTELIRLVAIAYFGPKDLVLIPQPTYGEYEIACQLVEADVLKQPMQKENNFHLDIAETVDLIRKHQPKGIFLCNPNNPTGQYLAKEEMQQILSVSEDSLVILDEAYIAFTKNAWPSLDLVSRGNLVILRSMTKDYALAGLRLGYTIAAEPIISVLKRVRPPWSINAAAQKAGIVALNVDGYLEECSTKIQEAKSFLVRELTYLGLAPLPSQTNFFLVEVGNGAEFRQALLKRRILVRDCTSFGLPNYIRLAPRTLPECQRLIAAVKDTGVCSHGS
jgi:histidinol-phosphate aminotransferase